METQIESKKKFCSAGSPRPSSTCIGRRLRRRQARPKNSAAGGEKKIRPFGDQNLKENNSAAGGEKKFRPLGGQNLKENNRQKERGNRKTKHEQTTKTPKNGKCQFFQTKKPKLFCRRRFVVDIRRRKKNPSADVILQK